jgi:transcription elongation factor GreB
MTRYRPPQKRGSPYITQAGFDALKQELDHLWKVERPQVTATVRWAASNGDRSENGDYIYGKKRLREIDSRVRFLQKRLDELKIIDKAPSDTSKIYFGAHITIEKEDGAQLNYHIVGPDEFDLSQGKISLDSPFARALIGKKRDDEISWVLNEKSQQLVIIDIRYIS